MTILLSAAVLNGVPLEIFFFEVLVILSAILLPIKSPVASAVFLIALSEAVFITSTADFLAV